MTTKTRIVKIGNSRGTRVPKVLLDQALLRRLTPEQWQRGSVYVTLDRMTFADWVALIAAHDDKHLAQLRGALEGLP